MTPTRPGPVLITGCSSGIGAATARLLADEGWTVYATARRTETLADLAAAGCETLALDVTDEDSMVNAVNAVETAHVHVHALVNNAGYGLHGPVETLAMDDVHRQFETNVFGLLRLTQLVLPGMRHSGAGRIVNLSSVGGRVTLPGGGAYHASKYAVEALSDALRFEVSGFGIGVSLVEPGPVKTRFGDTALATVEHDGTEHGDADNPYADFEASLQANIESAYEGPLARAASFPEDVAKVIERAITSAHPKARYPVGLPARSLVNMKRLLPDAALDLALHTQYKAPKQR